MQLPEQNKSQTHPQKQKNIFDYRHRMAVNRFTLEPESLWNTNSIDRSFLIDIGDIREATITENSPPTNNKNNQNQPMPQNQTQNTVNVQAQNQNTTETKIADWVQTEFVKATKGDLEAEKRSIRQYFWVRDQCYQSTKYFSQ